jgi:signal transduction histidine kinase
MVWPAVEIKTLLGVVAMRLDESGVLLEANAGFQRILGADNTAPINSNVAHYFIQPTLSTLAAAPITEDGSVYRGLLTVGDYDGKTRSLRASVWREGAEIRIVADFDIEEFERINDAVLDINRNYASTQRELAQANIKLRLANAELEQHRNHLEDLVLTRTAELAASRDAAEAANRAKTIFLANMSHELRTPLHGIMGMTTLARRRISDPKALEQLDHAQTSAFRLQKLITDLIDISAIEAARVSLHRDPFSMMAVLESQQAQLAQAAAGKGLQWAIEIAPVLGQHLFIGDAVRFGQLLTNMCENAVKFTHHGSVTLRARVIADTATELTLRVEIQDTGIGISDEDQRQLFSLFIQADGSHTRKYGGTGLGLVISKRLIELMGGTIGVTSKEGVGSTFWVELGLEKRGAGSAISSATVTDSAAAG